MAEGSPTRKKRIRTQKRRERTTQKKREESHNWTGRTKKRGKCTPGEKKMHST